MRDKECIYMDGYQIYVQSERVSERASDLKYHDGNGNTIRRYVLALNRMVSFVREYVEELESVQLTTVGDNSGLPNIIEVVRATLFELLQIITNSNDKTKKKLNRVYGNLSNEYFSLKRVLLM